MHRPSLSLAALGLLAGCSKPGPQQQQAAAPAGVQWAVVVLYNHPKTRRRSRSTTRKRTCRCSRPTPKRSV